MADFARYLKATPPAAGSPGVFYPGEVEHICAQERAKSGIDVEDTTWNKLAVLAAEYSLAAELELKWRATNTAVVVPMCMGGRKEK